MEHPPIGPVPTDDACMDNTGGVFHADIPPPPLRYGKVESEPLANIPPPPLGYGKIEFAPLDDNSDEDHREQLLAIAKRFDGLYRTIARIRFMVADNGQPHAKAYNTLVESILKQLGNFSTAIAKHTIANYAHNDNKDVWPDYMSALLRDLSDLLQVVIFNRQLIGDWPLNVIMNSRDEVIRIEVELENL